MKWLGTLIWLGLYTGIWVSLFGRKLIFEPYVLFLYFGSIAIIVARIKLGKMLLREEAVRKRHSRWIEKATRESWDYKKHPKQDDRYEQETHSHL